MDNLQVTDGRSRKILTKCTNCGHALFRAPHVRNPKCYECKVVEKKKYMKDKKVLGEVGSN